MDFIAIVIAAILGWNYATLGLREVKAIALVVAGWTAVTTAASVPYLTIEGFVSSLAYHAVVVTVPYALGALARRLFGRRR